MEESRGGGAWKDWKHQLDELRGGKKDVQRLRLHFQQRHFAFPFAAFCLVLFAAGGWAPAHFCSFSSFGPTDGEGGRAPALARPPPRPGNSVAKLLKVQILKGQKGQERMHHLKGSKKTVGKTAARPHAALLPAHLPSAR